MLDLLTQPHNSGPYVQIGMIMVFEMWRYFCSTQNRQNDAVVILRLHTFRFPFSQFEWQRIDLKRNVPALDQTLHVV
jgi:hypothetical protein